MAVGKYVTQDNLGIGPSTIYGYNQSQYDKQLAADSNLFPLKTTSSSTEPYSAIPPELAHLFSPSIKTSLSASFASPLDYDVSALFVRELLALSLGSKEAQEEVLEKIDNQLADWEQEAPSAKDKKSLEHLKSAMKNVLELSRDLELARDNLAKFYKA